MLKKAIATEELQEWRSVSIVHDSLTGIDGLYYPLLLGAVNDSEDMAASAMGFAPGMWLNPLPDSGNRFGALISESVFTAADVVCSRFPRVS